MYIHVNISKYILYVWKNKQYTYIYYVNKNFYLNAINHLTALIYILSNYFYF